QRGLGDPAIRELRLRQRAVQRRVLADERDPGGGASGRRARDLGRRTSRAVCTDRVRSGGCLAETAPLTASQRRPSEDSEAGSQSDDGDRGPGPRKLRHLGYGWDGVVLDERGSVVRLEIGV